MKNEDLPKRKHPRLKGTDYSSNGMYFITICTEKKRCTLSRVVGFAHEENPNCIVGEDELLESVKIECTEWGSIAEKQLLLLEERYPFVKIMQYVIMPNHIHLVMRLDDETAGASPRPTIMDVVCAYKSLTTRACKKNGLVDKLFQTSFYEHVIRNQKDYDEIVKYIYENPLRWYYDELYAEES
jgi:REP element-mobilizing transposase RayT